MLTAELEKNTYRRFTLSEVESILEIMSFPLFYRLRRATGGEQVGCKNLHWEKEEFKQDHSRSKASKKPQMLLHAPKDDRYKRAWHFFKIFPTKEFEYCTRIELEQHYDKRLITEFNTVAFFAAWFPIRRLTLTSAIGYRKNLP